MKKSAILELIGRIPTTRPAILEGYEKEFDTRNGFYATKKRSDSAIEGILLQGLTDDEIMGLDRYEGLGKGLYIRKEDEVKTEGGKVIAFFYARE